MPYSSKAQQRYFHYLESKGKMPKKTVDEFDEATDFKHLPEEVEHDAHGGMAHYAYGGEVPENYDVEMGEAHEYDSSGEPHTEYKFEDEQPMEFMSRGGKVRRMSKGGMIHSRNFAKALRKAY